MKKNFFVLLSILCISTLSGCVSGKLHRPDTTSICTITDNGDKTPCPNHSLQTKQIKTDSYLHSYLLGIVEFDDQGQFHKRQQLTSLLDQLKKEAKDNSLLIVTFVHGWHHSAKEDDDNLQGFKGLLETISKEVSLSKEESQRKRKTVGVYLGWRGDSIAIPVLNNMTFWDRKEVAETIGTQGAVTETLLELEKIVKLLNSEKNSHKEDSRLVIVGHSFGGLIVYSALAHILLDRSVASDSIADGVGDLIVLINPAFEALRFANLYLSAKSKKYDERQPPLMVILTSKGDMATGIAFPIGRFLSTVVNFYRKIGEYRKVDGLGEFKADIAAIGHFKPFQNGKWEKLDPSDQGSKADSPERIKNIQTLLTDTNCVEGEEHSVNFLKTELKLKCSPRNHLHYPYWVVSVDEEIIPDHSITGNDVSVKIGDFVRYLILFIRKRDSNVVSDVRRELENRSDGKPEYCSNSALWKQPASHNEKVNMARTWELRGFQQLIKEDWECAKLAFENSYKTWPTYHSVEEILKLLDDKKDPQRDRCVIYRRILKDYSWGMPKDFKESMEGKMEGKCR